MAKIEDFGFTFEDESEITAENNITKTKYGELQQNYDELNRDYSELHDKHQKLLKLVMNLLTNLSKDPKKSTIKWPNRSEVIEKLIREVQELK